MILPGASCCLAVSHVGAFGLGARFADWFTVAAVACGCCPRPARFERDRCAAVAVPVGDLPLSVSLGHRWRASLDRCGECWGDRVPCRRSDCTGRRRRARHTPCNAASCVRVRGLHNSSGRLDDRPCCGVVFVRCDAGSATGFGCEASCPRFSGCGSGFGGVHVDNHTHSVTPCQHI